MAHAAPADSYRRDLRCAQGLSVAASSDVGTTNKQDAVSTTFHDFVPKHASSTVQELSGADSGLRFDSQGLRVPTRPAVGTTTLEQ